jgi:hypothetical protein
VSSKKGDNCAAQEQIHRTQHSTANSADAVCSCISPIDFFFPFSTLLSHKLLIAQGKKGIFFLQLGLEAAFTHPLEHGEKNKKPVPPVCLTAS